MKHFLPLIAALFIFQSAHAQITITSADMPAAGDMLGFSNATATGTGFSPADSGMGMSWNYALSPTSQGVNAFQTAYEVNPIYAATISLTAFGYKVADSIPGLSLIPGLGVSVTNIYTFFKEISTPRAAYIAAANGYTVSNTFPAASNYTNPDVWYFFPLAYGNPTDSVDYSIDMGLMGTVDLKETGYRKTRVDGWGTITTPYFTTPVNCIRVRSEIHEIDSISLMGFSFGIPRNSVEYKWLVNGEHYPALWITSNVMGGTETVTTVRYRDTVVISKVANATSGIYTVTAFPNPAINGMVTLSIPSDWKTFQAEVFDIQGKELAVVNNDPQINVQSFPAGQYLVRVTSGSNTGYVKITKE